MTAQAVIKISGEADDGLWWKNGIIHCTAGYGCTIYDGDTGALLQSWPYSLEQPWTPPEGVTHLKLHYNNPTMGGADPAEQAV